MPPVLPPAIQLLQPPARRRRRHQQRAPEHPKPPRRRQKRRRLPVPVMQVRQPLRRQRRKRRQPHRQPQRKHLRQMQQRQQVQQRPAQQPPRHQHRRHPLTPPHLIPAHHWRRKQYCCRSSSHQSRRCRKTGRRYRGRDFPGRCQPDEKGIVKLSSATDSDSEALAATPKAVHAVMDEVQTKRRWTVRH